MAIIPSNVGFQPDDDGLNEHLAQDPADPEPVKPRWQPDDDRAAEYCMRRLAEFEIQAAAIQTQADEYRMEIDRWLESAAGEARRSAEYFRGQLIGYQLRRMEADPKAKSLKLPSGKIGVTDRRKTVSFEVLDPVAFAEWAAEALDGEELEAIIPPQPPKVLPSKMKGVIEAVETEGGGYLAISPAGEPVPGVTVKTGDLSIKPTPDMSGKGL